MEIEDSQDVPTMTRASSESRIKSTKIAKLTGSEDVYTMVDKLITSGKHFSSS